VKIFGSRLLVAIRIRGICVNCRGLSENIRIAIRNHDPKQGVICKNTGAICKSSRSEYFGSSSFLASCRPPLAAAMLPGRIAKLRSLWLQENRAARWHHQLAHGVSSDGPKAAAHEFVRNQLARAPLRRGACARETKGAADRAQGVKGPG
jgi:hypothetical protein